MTAQRVISPADSARRQAIQELHRAILALEIGEVTEAANHAHASLAWIREIQ